VGAGRVVRVSLYEALSLVVSTVGTLGTVYIGLRQLRQSAPARQTPAPYAYSAPHDYATGPGYPGPHRPVHLPPPAPRRRPPPVTAASLALYGAASAQPFFVGLYYIIRLATAPSATAAELGSEGILDVLFFGAVAFFSALLGVFVARGSRVALWFVWVLGILSTVTLCALAGSAALAALGPEAANLGGFGLLFLVYFAVVLVAYIVGAVLLTNAQARAYFRRT
jgi:hypothetical protein